LILSTGASCDVDWIYIGAVDGRSGIFCTFIRVVDTYLLLGIVGVALLEISQFLALSSLISILHGDELIAVFHV